MRFLSPSEAKTNRQHQRLDFKNVPEDLAKGGDDGREAGGGQGRAHLSPANHRFKQMPTAPDIFRACFGRYF